MTFDEYKAECFSCLRLGDDDDTHESDNQPPAVSHTDRTSSLCLASAMANSVHIPEHNNFDPVFDPLTSVPHCFLAFLLSCLHLAVHVVRVVMADPFKTCSVDDASDSAVARTQDPC